MKKLFFLLSISGIFLAAEKPVSSKFLHTMLNLDNDDFLQMLKLSPTTVDLTNEEGNTLLFLAVSEGQNEKLKILLNGQLLRQPRTDIVNKSGMSPLHCAASRANVFATVELVKRKVNLKLTDNEGNTPLHCLLKDYERESEILKVGEIIAGGIYPSKYDYSLLAIEDKAKETPVDVALKIRNMPAICLFLNICNKPCYEQPCQFEDLKKSIKTKILTHFKKEEELLGLVEFSVRIALESHNQQERLIAKLAKKDYDLKALQKTKP